MTADKIKEDFVFSRKTTRLYVSNMVLGLGRGGRLLVSNALEISRIGINNGMMS